MVRGDEGGSAGLLELRHRSLSHRDHPAWLCRPANRDRPQAGMGRTQHARHERTRGRAVCEATEPRRLGGLMAIDLFKSLLLVAFTVACFASSFRAADAKATELLKL